MPEILFNAVCPACLPGVLDTVTAHFGLLLRLEIGAVEFVGRREFLGKMPGDERMKFSGVRTYLGYMMAFPAKKLLPLKRFA